MVRLASCGLLLAVTGAGWAQSPRLLRDINTVPLSNPDSLPHGFATGGAFTYFAATHLETGTELWRTTGNPGGTRSLKDIRAGKYGSEPTKLTVVGSTLFFAARETGQGTALFRSDGTGPGTIRVKEFRSSNRPLLSELTPFRGLLFFLADGALYRSDGTTAGTVRLRDGAGRALSGSNLAVLGNRLLFAGWSGQGSAIWQSDGTSAGTSVVQSFGLHQPQRLAVAGRFVFFDMHTPQAGNELWRTDGTAAGTVLVKDIAAGSGSSFPFLLVGAGNLVFFWTIDLTGTASLWRSDGSGAGTVKLAAGRTTASPLVAFKNAVWFNQDSELWRSDGTLAGTGRFFTTKANLMAVAATRLWFTSSGGLWMTDGTASGTRLVRTNLDVRAIGEGTHGRVLLSAKGDDRGVELWTSDGTAAGTKLLTDVNPVPPGYSGGSNILGIVEGLGRAWFQADDGVHGQEPWVCDGTAAGTVMIKDVRPGPTGAGANFMTPLGDNMYFVADDGVHGQEIWKTDGTPAGTTMLLDLNPGPRGSVPIPYRVGSHILFFADDGKLGRELWVTDGSVPGTRLVKDHVVGPGGSDPGSAVVFRNRLFYTPGQGPLWVSDGTPRGTQQLRAFAASRYVGFMPFGAEVVFTADDGRVGTELWKTDGTPAGTVLIADLVAGPRGSFPQLYGVARHGVLFHAQVGTQVGLWRTDGTARGTISLSAQTARGGPAVSVGGQFLFPGWDVTNGQQLWTTDGTPQGTRLLKVLGPGNTIFPSLGVVVGSRFAWFGAVTGDYRLWKTDGTAAGTREVVSMGWR